MHARLNTMIWNIFLTCRAHSSSGHQGYLDL